MSAELVTVVIDDREVQVAKGTGIVETALSAGIEIPVFCYEPRLGPAVGACRMCLCEVEGMPKLQAVCTMTAQDGMVVRTAQTSAKAAEGQDATLEFILVNHPLDCPVCDKGGECPLQDLTFRWGPGNTRMEFEKLTVEKPIPVSPAIALDRERCILCYRCTRFSEDVAEDGQLVAVNRGASSVIATFEDRPYRAPFSGNVIELCPVGALTSTQYRFLGRPWEIQNVPTVCGLCPVGCNVHATMREGKVRRMLSRNHPEVDEGWLCDKGRFAFTHLYARDRITDPLRRVRQRGFEELSWDDALDEAERLLREAQGRIVTALSGSETVEQAYALGQAPARGPRRAHRRPSGGDEQRARRLPPAALGDPRRRARGRARRRARRRSARRSSTSGCGPPAARGARIEYTGDALESCRRLAGARDALGKQLRASERAILIWSAEEGSGGSHLAALAGKLGFDDKPGSGAFHLPTTPNGRGIADAWAACCDEEAESPEKIGLLVVSGDEAAADPNVRVLAERAEHVLVTSMFQGLAVGWADLVLPGTSYLERDGTYVNLEGRLQRLRRAAIPPAPDELAWISKLAERFDVDVPPYASAVFAELSALIYDGLPFGEVGERAELRTRSVAPPAELPDEPPAPAGGTGLKLVRYRGLFSGPAVERVPELQFQRPPPEVELSPEDAEARGIMNGEPVSVSHVGAVRQLRARVNPSLRPGIVRIASEHAGELGGLVEVTKP